MSARLILSNLYARLRWPQLRPSFAAPSHLTGLERAELYRLVRRHRPRVIVEIGSYLGASALAMAEALPEDGRVYCIDTWQNDGMSEGGRDTYAEFCRRTADRGQVIEPVRGWSTEIAPALLARLDRIDLLFIDGDHSYDGVAADWRTFGPALAPGGVVAFHDIGWAEGVRRLVAEEVRPRVVAQGGQPNLWWGHLPS